MQKILAWIGVALLCVFGAWFVVELIASQEMQEAALKSDYRQ